MLASTHDLPWNYGLFGEQFCVQPAMRLNSTVKLDAAQAQDAENLQQPLQNESYITLDWQLPLTPEGQCILFRRIRSTFDRATAMIPLNSKKKYRMGPEDLLRTRNMCALFSQILGHPRSRLDSHEIGQWMTEVTSGLGRDEDLMDLLQSKPPVFSLSMLASYRRKAQVDRDEAEMKRVEKVASQKQEVLAAQWSYFTSALEKDHALLEKVAAAPALVRQAIHVKGVAHRAKVIQEAESACVGYQNTFLRVTSLDNGNMQLAKGEISKMKLEMVAWVPSVLMILLGGL